VTARDFSTAMGAVAPSSISRLLYRGVNLSSLLSKVPHEPLFMGGRENRFNPAGIPALYLAEDFASAYSETVQQTLETLVRHSAAQECAAPVVLFGMQVVVEDAVLDLTQSSTRERLGVTPSELDGPWRWVRAENPKDLTLTQRIGKAAYDSGRFAAIRYASTKVMNDNRMIPGLCWVVFADRLTRSTGLLKVMDVSGTLAGGLP
jgi:hypothetical protein